MVLGKEQPTTLDQQLEAQRTSAVAEGQKISLQEDLAHTRAMSAQQQTSEVLSDLQAQQAAKEVTVSMQQGELPSNPVIAGILERGEAATAQSIANPNISSDARQAAEDLRNLLSVTREVFLQKNQDEALQRLVHYSKEATAASASVAGSAAATGVASNVRQKSGELAMTTYNLIKLMARSSEFRRLIMDLVNIVADSTRNKFEGASQTMRQHDEPEGAASEMRDRTRAQAQEAKETLKDKGVQDELIDRFHFWIKRINRREDYRQGIRELIETLDDFIKFGAGDNETNAELRDNPQLLQARLNSARARAEAKKLVERFSSGYQLDNLTQSLRKLMEDVKDDEAVRNYVYDLREFVMRSVNDPDFVSSESWPGEVRKKRDDGRRVFERVRPDLDNFVEQSRLFMNAFSGDPQLTAISQSMKNFVQHLFYDQNGNPKLKPGVLLDLRSIIGPLLQEQLKYIYVPRLASDDENITWVLDNVMLKGEDVMPDKIVVENYNKMVVSPTSSRPEDQAIGSTLRVHISGIRAHVYDVRMAYSRKTFPKMEDVITFDAHLAGEGLTMNIILSTNPRPDHVFRIVSIDTDVDEFTLNNIHGVDHGNVLYTLMKPIIQTQVRRNMEQSITEALRSRLQDLDQLLLSYKDRINLV